MTPTFVLLHGLTFDRRLWEPVLAALPASAPAVALDLPGHGAEPPLPEPGLEPVADWLPRRPNRGRDRGADPGRPLNRRTDRHHLRLRAPDRRRRLSRRQPPLRALRRQPKGATPTACRPQLRHCLGHLPRKHAHGRRAGGVPQSTLAWRPRLTADSAELPVRPARRVDGRSGGQARHRVRPPTGRPGALPGAIRQPDRPDRARLVRRGIAARPGRGVAGRPPLPTARQPRAVRPTPHRLRGLRAGIPGVCRKRTGDSKDIALIVIRGPVNITYPALSESTVLDRLRRPRGCTPKHRRSAAATDLPVTDAKASSTDPVQR